MFICCFFQLHEAVEEAEEQRRQVQVAKKKAQRLTAEMQDTKLHLEEQMARNNELERKQRRYSIHEVQYMATAQNWC